MVDEEEEEDEDEDERGERAQLLLKDEEASAATRATETRIAMEVEQVAALQQQVDTHEKAMAAQAAAHAVEVASLHAQIAAHGSEAVLAVQVPPTPRAEIEATADKPAHCCDGCAFVGVALSFVAAAACAILRSSSKVTVKQ